MSIVLEITPLKRIHVIKRRTKWAIVRHGASKAAKIYDTKEEAIKSAKKWVVAGYDLVVHKSDGSIELWKKSAPVAK